MAHQRSLARLSEPELLDRFSDLVRRDRHNTAQLLATIGEIDERKLWAKHACPSMFAFCVERFHMSESVTAKRIWAARTARRFPVILKMVARGELTPSAIQLLSKYLTEENHRPVLARAKHKSTREIEQLVAHLAPKPDVPSRIRALPRTSRRAADLRQNPEVECDAGRSEAQAGNRGSVVDGASRASNGTSAVASSPERTPRGGTITGQPDNTAQRSGLVVPLSPRRYKLELTVDQKTHDKLRALQDLLSHESPNTDPAMIVSKAIDRLLDETLKTKAAVHTGTHRQGRRTTDRPEKHRTRAIPAAVRHAVWRRDEGRCTFVDSKGRRCRETRAIEYHHQTPYARGGKHEESNIALRCRAHNQYQADLDFGRRFMRSKRGRDAEDCARNVHQSADGSPHSPFPARPRRAASPGAKTSYRVLRDELPARGERKGRRAPTVTAPSNAGATLPESTAGRERSHSTPLR